MKLLSFFYFLISFITVVFSFGFVDPNLHLSSSPLFFFLQIPLLHLVYQQRTVAACITGGIMIVFFLLYINMLHKIHSFSAFPFPSKRVYFLFKYTFSVKYTCTKFINVLLLKFSNKHTYFFLYK